MQKPTENETVKTKEVKEPKEKHPTLSIYRQLANFKAICQVPYTVKKNKVHTIRALNVECPVDLIPDNVLRIKREYDRRETTSKGRLIYIRKKLKNYGLIQEPIKKEPKDVNESRRAARLEKKKQLAELEELRKFKDSVERKSLLN